MFGDQGGKHRHHYGSDAHTHIDRLIAKSRKVLIVSPYIDIYYAKKISSWARRRQFYIIASSMDKDARNELRGNGRLWMLSASALATLIILYVFVIYGIRGYPVFASALPLLYGIFRYIKGWMSARGVHLKTPKRFVHAKMYISENEAVTGSANLTYKGTHSNVEHIEVIRNPDEVKSLAGQFWGLWRKF